MHNRSCFHSKKISGTTNADHRALEKRATATGCMTEKTHVEEKPLHCIVCFDQNVTVFAGRLSKSTGQLMLMRASGVENAISAILFL
jgi:hypothetical protein